MVFDVVNKHLRPLIEVSTLVLYEAELENADVNTLALDEGRTRDAAGREFFFLKKSYIEKGKVLRRPVTTSVSYPVGAGLPLDWQ